MIEDKELVRLANEAKINSYSPYSRFRVGSAILTEDGKIYTGANIENASYGATCCAERTAVFKGISEGMLKIAVVAIASDEKDFIYPCGICRQVLVEFGTPKTRILCSNSKGEYIENTLEELLPKAFVKFNAENS